MKSLTCTFAMLVVMLSAISIDENALEAWVSNEDSYESVAERLVNGLQHVADVAHLQTKAFYDEESDKREGVDCDEPRFKPASEEECVWS